MRAYLSLLDHFEKINHFEGARSMLSWDGAAMMPSGGAEARAGQVAALSVLIHQLTCDPQVRDWLSIAEAEVAVATRAGDLEEAAWARANLREMRRVVQHASAVPDALVKSFSEAGSRCEMVWREARAENDFKRLQPYLEEVLRLTREIADIKSEVLQVTPYEALLDQYEPGAREDRIDSIFAQLSLSLPNIIEEAIDAQGLCDRLSPLPSLQGPFSIEDQRGLGLEVMDLLGFDFSHGRLDVSHHPFCGGTPSDVRITTRYNEQQFTQSLMGVIHETGHALYEQGLPQRYRAYPVGRARGMSVHESQSLFWEMQVGRSAPFIELISPMVAEAFGGDPERSEWSPAGLRRAYTRVERSLIRVDADEVTYPAHVILRYGLERKMLGGELEIADLPDAWNDEMERLVGVRPPSNKDGCMQDIHWMDGAFGYFPTYTLGAMTAAQLFQSLQAEMPDVHDMIREGALTEVLGWLRDKVHRVGSSLTTDELLISATGRPLEVTPFIQHLRRRYVDSVLLNIEDAQSAREVLSQPPREISAPPTTPSDPPLASSGPLHPPSAPPLVPTAPPAQSSLPPQSPEQPAVQTQAPSLIDPPASLHLIAEQERLIAEASGSLGEAVEAHDFFDMSDLAEVERELEGIETPTDEMPTVTGADFSTQFGGFAEGSREERSLISQLSVESDLADIDAFDPLDSAEALSLPELEELDEPEIDIDLSSSRDEALEEALEAALQGARGEPALELPEEAQDALGSTPPQALEGLELDLGIDPGPSAYEPDPPAGLDLSDFEFEGFEGDAQSAPSPPQPSQREREALAFSDAYQPMPTPTPAQPAESLSVQQRVASLMERTTPRSTPPAPPAPPASEPPAPPAPSARAVAPTSPAPSARAVAPTSPARPVAPTSPAPPAPPSATPEPRSAPSGPIFKLPT